MTKLTNPAQRDIDAFLRARPRIAGVIVDGLKLAAAKKAVRLGADVIELRVDTFRKTDSALVDSIKAIRADKSLARVPLLLTIRSLKEGGKTAITDKKRHELYAALMPLCDIVDIELSSGRILKDVINLANKAGKRVIVSYHNFASAPKAKKLRSIIKDSRATGADYVKIAAIAHGREDIKRLAGLLVEDDALIVIAMGERGRPSRVFFPLLGSLLTYGSVADATAPGQMTVGNIKKAWKPYGV